MNNNLSIDIVVPSYRLDEAVLLRIINLQKAEGFHTEIFIIADNPNIQVPLSLQQLDENGYIHLIINKTNLGFSASRNKGICAGKSKWILLLDDDIKPGADLLLNYAEAIIKNENAIGFVGVTKFPEPFNNATKALQFSGITGHFESAGRVTEMRWAPTANVVLNRYKLDENLFDEKLKAGGEDIDFLLRNSILFGAKYISVPDAIVVHPWWNNGAIQTKRLWRYGIAASEIAEKQPVKQYTYHDFTNTSETVLLLLIALPITAFFGKAYFILALIMIVMLAEFTTNYLKAIITGKAYSPLIAAYLTWIKNCREAGQLYGVLKGNLNGFARRIELGFNKPHPSPFRLNKWKIIKMVLILAGVLAMLFISI